MSDYEIGKILGYYMILDGPIEIDIYNFELTDENYGLDFFQPPLITIQTELSPQTITETLSFLMDKMIRHVEHHRIPGEIILSFELVTLGFDNKITCKAYKRVY